MWRPMPRRAPVTNATFASDITPNRIRSRPACTPYAGALQILSWPDPESGGRLLFMKCPRFIVAIFAALAMTVFVNARFAFAQEAAESGTSVDAGWDRTAPTIDDSASSADKVLEIPQAPCNKDDPPAPCDPSAAPPDDPNDEAINAPQPGSPPPVLDDDTASSAATAPDWG